MKRFLLPIFLAGCASAHPATQVVKVPVYTPCVKVVPAKPVLSSRSLAPDASDGEKVLAIIRDLLASLKYEGALEAVVEGCR
jgi:hypothetical protein